MRGWSVGGYGEVQQRYLRDVSGGVFAVYDIVQSLPFFIDF